MNAEKGHNAYPRHSATVILAGVKLVGKDDTVRKVYFIFMNIKI